MNHNSSAIGRMASTCPTHRLNYYFGPSYDTVCSLSGDGTSMGHTIHRPHLSTARDARAVRTREALRRALLRLLDLKPLEQITIRDICEVARVGYTTFFRHYPTKGALLNDGAADEMGRLVGLAMSVADSSDDTRAASIALCTYV